MKGLKLRKKIQAAVLAAAVFLGALSLPTVETKAAQAVPTVSYVVHAQTYGWMNVCKNGETAGTTGKGKRLEALAVSLNLNGTGLTGGLQYRVHQQTYGWTNWTEAPTNGASPTSLIAGKQYAGATGQSKRLEAVQMKLTGEIAEQYEVLYRVHMQTYGWGPWTRNGATAGTTGQGKRVEAIEIRLIAKPTIEPTASVQYSVHSQTYGWMSAVSNGATAGTTGESKRLESIKINLNTSGVSGGITYKTHVQTYGWTKESSNGAESGTTGQAKRMEAICISLTGDISAYYDVYYRVHSQTYGWLDWAKNGEKAGTENGAKRMEAIQIKLVKKGEAAPGATTKPYVYVETPKITADTYVIRVNKQESCVTIYKDGNPIKAMICSPGDATPLGTYSLKTKWRWHTLMGGVQGQYCGQIVGGILFHSVLYNSTNPRTLVASSYNNLGKRVSHGCIRLQVIDAKWIYDNCPSGTRVEIYESSDPGPLGKPTINKIPSSQTWDPTDPSL